jgi:hypothetical protein
MAATSLTHLSVKDQTLSPLAGMKREMHGIFGELAHQ